MTRWTADRPCRFTGQERRRYAVSGRAHGTAFDDLSAADAELTLPSLLTPLGTMGRTDSPAELSSRTSGSHFLDTLAEYQWARDADGWMPSTIDQLVKPVLEIYEHFDLVPW
ncbi:hypothetical protein [Streptomyces anulatus]|uniref:hypothetical protein n=1 Tax=Streptomyces anulatus TaxID=1892 RepID=UPI00364317A8